MMKVLFVIFVTLAAIISADDHFHYVHCCGYAELLDHEVGSKCNQNVTSGDHYKEDVCILNCVAREMNLAEGNSFSISKFGELVDKMETDPEGQKFYKDKVKECVTENEELAKNYKDNDSVCSEKIYGIMVCLGKHVAIDCPAAKRIKSDECDHQLTFLKNVQKEFEKLHGKQK